MDPALARREIGIAARWWTESLVRRHDAARPDDLFAAPPEDARVTSDREDVFALALLAEIEASLKSDSIAWDPSFPLAGRSPMSRPEVTLLPRARRT